MKDMFDKKYSKLEKDGKTLTPKTDKELFEENIITKEEYNERINQKRETLYENKTDKQVIELSRNFFNKNKDNLLEEEKFVLDSINKEVEEIKTQYPKQN
ncbi:Hvp 28 VSH-1 tail protein [Brachyspira intermedia PWS/A]|uniref:Hvp 28 VSH-1 tail protein n=1 Tax=Brachyspira intermedia (strain ATCC 51140 / PWS/A) TaxID=1045858 RepID=G0EPR1_BRAIP|nr:hypothetical protein [Brachyspira intermedia]AEM20775.1 Hvp 28 VSH-1 tail protein [Brachyspira intermedia PWS/A]